MPAPHLVKGAQAERQAARHLFWRGWRIQARNWFGKHGELDIVASRWRTLLIVEVRRRASLDAAWASIDDDKRARLQRTARELVEAFQLWRYRIRYDLMAIDEHGRLARRRNVFR